MNDIEQRIAKLSPEKRQLLEAKLLAKRINQNALIDYKRYAADNPGILSSSQLRFWFLDRFEPENSVSNIPMLLKLNGALDIPKLEWAISSIVARHGALRTTFQGEDDQPVQIVADADVVSLERLDGVNTATQFSCRPFDLKVGPLARFGLLQVENQQHWLLVVMHHMISDGWSLNLFQAELVNLYTGNEQALPSLKAQYSDFASWQKMREPLLERQIDYWRKILDSSAGVLDLPVDRPRPKQRSYAGARFKTIIPGELRNALQSSGNQNQATLFITLLTTLNILLARYSGKRDISIGSPVAGRNHTDFENVIGVFINTIVLRNDLSGEPSFLEQLNRVREVTLDAFSNQEIPFEKLIERLQPERNIGHSPFFQVMLVLQNQTLAPNKMGDIQIEREFVEMGTSLFELTFIVQPRDDGLHLTVEYSTEIFEHQTISRLVGHWKIIMEAAINSPNTSIWDLPMLSEDERAVVLEASNIDASYRSPQLSSSEGAISEAQRAPDAADPNFRPNDLDNVPEPGRINDLFHHQALHVPDAVALSLNGSSMSYRELAGHVNRLANHLRKMGIRPNDLV
ncbi:MAG: condensation domain-containing protein, partial [Sneathiella sp.]